MLLWSGASISYLRRPIADYAESPGSAQARPRCVRSSRIFELSSATLIVVHKAELERCTEQFEVGLAPVAAVLSAIALATEEGLAEARPLHENEGAAFTM